MKPYNIKFKKTEIGFIPEGWKVVSIPEIGRVVTGKTPPTSVEEYWGFDYPFVTPSDIENFNIRYNYDVERYVTNKWYSKATNYFVPKNSICYVSIGSTIGKMCLLKEGSFTNQQINSIVVKSDINHDFIFYQIRNNQYNIRNEFGGGGTAKNIISKSIFQKIKIGMPPLPEQTQIAEILSSLDDKIELNRKMNETLEKIGQTLFKHWFVDFEFPDENGKPYKSSGGKMINIDIPYVPMAPELMNFMNFVGVFADRNIKGFEPGANEYLLDNFNPECHARFYRVKDLYNGTTPDVFIEKELVNEKFLCNKKDVLISLDGSIGRIAIGNEGAYSSGIYKIFSNPMFSYIHSSFIYFFLNSDYVQNLLKDYAKGATIQHASHAINRIWVPTNRNLVETFQIICDPVFNQILKNLEENRILTKIRDLLLPRLMSGKLRVK